MTAARARLADRVSIILRCSSVSSEAMSGLAEKPATDSGLGSGCGGGGGGLGAAAGFLAAAAGAFLGFGGALALLPVSLPVVPPFAMRVPSV
ncbi:hypothetical protein DMC18_12235 [Caulobacter sp. D5]|nr:hypothetical protein DMC18_12235 [Caulobacter sp. D5]